MEVADARRRSSAALHSLVRPAAAADFAGMVRLSASSGVFTEVELDSLLCDFAACDRAAGDRLLVYQQGAVAQGYIQYSPAPITAGSWYVYWIAVAKSAQGAGIGGALLGHAEADLRAAGARQILIETSAKAAYAPARSLYLGRGYELVATIPDYYAEGDDKCVFCRRL